MSPRPPSRSCSVRCWENSRDGSLRAVSFCIKSRQRKQVVATRVTLVCSIALSENGKLESLLLRSKSPSSWFGPVRKRYACSLLLKGLTYLLCDLTLRGRITGQMLYRSNGELPPRGIPIELEFEYKFQLSAGGPKPTLQAIATSRLYKLELEFCTRRAS